MSLNTSGKNKPQKLTKKQKQWLQKLGVDHMKPGVNMTPSLEYLKTTTPGMVCVRSTHPLTISITGHTLNIPANIEVVAPLGVIQSLKKDQNTKYSLKPSGKPFKDRFKRYNGENLDNKKLMVWRFGGIGDLMFSQPIIKYLKDKYPTCKIFYATAPANRYTFSFWPQGLVDLVTSTPFDAKLLDDTDYHLTFEGSIERCKEAHKLNAFDVFRKMANLEFNVEDYLPSAVPNPNIVDHYRPYVPDKTIVMQLRASSSVRSYPIAKAIPMINMLNDMGFSVGLMDSFDKHKEYDQILAQLNGHLKYPNMVYNFSRLSPDVSHCVAVMSLCCGAIGIDSAITHLAAALNKPTVGIYGPFTGDIRMNYYKTADWVSTPKEWNDSPEGCKKQPCYFHEAEARQCPYLSNNKYVGCMTCINTDNVVEKFVNLYEKFSGETT